jgi:hypothetical protein
MHQRKTAVDPVRLATLLGYAQADAKATGLSVPGPATPEALVDFMAHAGEHLFLPGDPNLDSQKRNVAIQVFLAFEIPAIVAFGKAWLQRWQQNSHTSWHQELAEIFERADPADLSDILLSHDQESVRQRSSMPFAEMLEFDVVLGIKRKWRR